MYTMKDTFYYIAGRFCPTGMGYNYEVTVKYNLKGDILAE